jgi:propanol-preferring alcohol dehydrogenase
MILRQPGPVEANPLEAVDLPAPDPGVGQVRIRVSVCAVCRTDLHIVEGELDLPKRPVVPGHQIVGIVEAVGEHAARFKPGDRVGVPWLHWTCGQCAFCQPDPENPDRSRENLCERARFTGLHVDGGYAEFVVAHEAFAYPLPEPLSDMAVAPLLCAGVIGFRALRLSNIRPGRRLGLYGFGGSAHIVIQIARHWGCEVYVFTRSEAHRRLALDLGAAWAGDAKDTPPAKMDSSVVFAPAGWIVPEALRVLEKGGTLSLAGIYMTPIPSMDYSLLYHERTIVSAANSTRADVEQLLRLGAEIPIRTEVEAFPLEDANRALQRLKHSHINGAGVLEIA